MPNRDWIFYQPDDLPPTVYPGRTDINRIIAETARVAGLTSSDLLGKCREKRVYHPRAVAMKVCSDYTDASLPAIGAAFNRDHTTVLSALRSFERWADDDVRRAVDSIAAMAGCFYKRKEAQ